MTESYLTIVHKNRVISIPKIVCDTLKIEVEDTVRVTIEKIKKE